MGWVHSPGRRRRRRRVTATDTAREAPETEAAPRGRRFTASGLLLGVGAISAVATLALWWLGTIPAEPEIEIGRHVFGNIPEIFVAGFYVVVSAFLFLTFYFFSQRAKNWQRGSVGRPLQAVEAPHPRAAPRPPDAHAARGSICRPHAHGDLLRLHRPVPRHGDARDRPPRSQTTSSSSRAASTRATRSSSTCSHSSTWPASAGRRCAATGLGRGGSGRRPNRRTPASFSCSR